MQKLILKNIILFTLLFAGKVGFGQIAQLRIDSIKTDSISCSDDSTGCLTIYISGIKDSYDISFLGSQNSTVKNLTSSVVTYCGFATGGVNIGIISKDRKQGDSKFFFIDASLPLIVEHKEDSVTCFGDTSGAIELSINSGIGPYSIKWSTGKTQTLAAPGTSTITGLSTGTYFFSVVDSSSGCTKEDTIIYPALDSIKPSFDINSTCVGIPITFTNTTQQSGSAASNYSWDFGGGTPNTSNSQGPNNITYFTGGVKNIKLHIDNANCSVDLDTTITLQAPPNIKTIPNTTVCNGDSIDLSTSGGIGYIWTPNTSLSNSKIESPKAFPTLNTTYIVAGTDIDGCIGRDTVSITVNPKPSLTVSNDTTICNGETTQLKVSGANSYSWSPNINISSTTSSNPTVTPLINTTYYVEGASSSNCKTIDSVRITLNQAVIITPSQDTTICLGDLATLKVSGAKTYLWTPSGTLSSSTDSTVTANPSIETTYKVTGTSANGCITSDSVKVSVSPIPNATASGSDTICQGDSIQITAGGGTTYLWDNATSLSDATSASPFAKPLATTTYTVTVSNGTCTDQASVTVFVLNQSLTSVSNDTTICSNSTAKLKATGGNTYSWAPFASLNDPNIPNPIATPTVTTEYIVQISNNGQCFIYDTVTVSVNTAPTTNTTADLSICQGDTASLSTSGGLAYTWLPNTKLVNNKVASTKAFPSASTLYTVLVDNLNGCSKLDSVFITVNNKAIATLNSDVDTICFLDTVNLSATGGINYQWSPAASILNQGSANTGAVPLSSTTYSIIALGAGGCNDTLSKTIHVLTPANLTTSNDTTICSGDTISIEAFGGINYQWIPNQNIINPTSSKPSVFPTSTTDYIVRATTGGLCPSVDTVSITVFDKPNLGSINDTTICLGSTLSLDFSTPGTYTWSPTIEADFSTPQKPKFSPTTNRSYFLEFSDGNSCTVFDTLKINTATSPNAIITGDTTICIGSPLNLSSTNPSVTYEWKQGLTVLSNTPTLTVNGLKANTQVNLKLTDNFGCTSTDSVKVIVFNFPKLKLANDTSICRKDTVKLNLSTDYSYSWSPTLEMTGSNSTNPKFFPSISRRYIATVFDKVECTIKDTININILPIPSASIISKNTVCYNETVNISGSGGIAQNWDINGTLLAGANITFPAKNDLNISLTTIGANGCENTITKTILADDSLELSIIAPDSICEGNTISIQTTNNFIDSLLWNNTLKTGKNGSIPITLLKSDTTIIVKGFNALGCETTMQKTIFRADLPNFTLSGDDSLCIGESSIITANGNYTYTWPIQASLIQNTNTTASYTGLSSDTISVEALDSKGCKNSNDFIINVSPYPTKSLALNDSLCIGDSITFIGDINNTYSSSSLNQIQISSNEFKIFPTTNSQFIVTITNSFGCFINDTSNIVVNNSSTINLVPSLTICSNATDTIKASASNIKTITWSPSLGLGNPNSLITSVSTTINQDYILTVIDNNNCSNSDTISINVNTSPTLSTSADTALCRGNSTTLTVNGATTYEWSPSNKISSTTGNSTQFNYDTTSTIQVIGTTGLCSDTSLITISILALPTASLIIDDSTLCSGSNTNITINRLSGISNPTGSYSFDNKNTFTASNTINISPKNDTTIVAYLRDVFGCISDPITKKIITYAPITAIIDTINYPICLGPPGAFNAHTFKGGTAPYSYEFNGSPSSTINLDTLKFTNLAQGIHNLKITDINACEANQSIKFKSSILFDTLTHDIKCFGQNNGSIALSNFSGGVKPYTLALSPSTIFKSDSVFSNLTSGNYTVLVRDSTGCEVLNNFNIKAPVQLDLQITLKNDVTCFGLNDGTVGVNIIGGSAPFSLKGFGNTIISNGAHTFLNLDGQSENIKVTDSHFCKDSVDVLIEAKEDFRTDVSQTNFFCISGNLSAKIDTTIGGSGANKYSLDLGNTFQNKSKTNAKLIGLNAGNHTIITQDSLIGCKDTSSFTITTFNGINLDSIKITSTTASCSGNDATLSITKIQGGTKPYSFELYDSVFTTITNPVQLDSNFTNLSLGIKGILISDNSGCKYQFRDTIAPNPISGLNILVSNDTSICRGNTADLKVSGATSYSWSPNFKLTSATGDNNQFIYDTTSTIRVIGNIGNCKDTAFVKITIIDEPTGNINIDDATLCDGVSANINAQLTTGTTNPNGSYSFDNKLSFTKTNSLKINPKADTVITVYFRDVFGCVSKPITQNIVRYTPISAIIDTVNFPLCVGPPGAFNAHTFMGGTAPYTYEFNGSTPTIINVDTLKFNNLVQGLYNLKLTDINQCSNNFGINFLSNLKFDTLINDLSCNNSNDGSISLSNFRGGIAPYILAKSPSSVYTSDSTFSNLVAGNHTILLKDGTGCEALANFEITQPDSLSIALTLQNDVTCYGLNDGTIGLTISGGSPLYTITAFDTTLTTIGLHTYFNLSNQTEQIIVADVNSCKDTLVVKIEAKEDFKTSISQTSFDCIANNLNAKIDTTIGGSGANKYSLDLGNTFQNESLTNSKLIGLNAGIHTIITFDTLVGCKDTTSFKVITFDGINVDSVTISTLAPTCIGNNGSIKLSNLQGGPRPLNFELFDSIFISPLIPIQSDSSFTNLTSGIKGILITDKDGCKYQFIDTVGTKSALVASITTKNIDCNSVNGEVNITISNGSGAYKIGLDKNNTISGSKISKLDSGTYTIYYLDEIDVNKCIDSSIVQIESSNVNLIISTFNTLCFNDSTGQVNIDSIINGNSSDFSYSFSLDSILFKDTRNFNKLKAKDYNIFTEQTNLSNGKKCSFRTTLFQNNIKSDSFTILHADSIKATIIAKPDGKELDFTGSVWAHSIKGGTPPLEVNFNDRNDWISYSSKDSLDTYFGSLEDGVYPVYIRDANACLIELSAVVGSEFNIPNIFTPNGDGKNDVFFINNLPDKNSLRVFDRWGALIYKMRDYDNSWDGNRQADGTYFYVLETPTNTIKGWIQIVR